MGRWGAIIEVGGGMLMAGATALFIVLDFLGVAEQQLDDGTTDSFGWHIPALIALAIFCGIVAQRWYRYARLVKNPLPPETLEHHQRLKRMLDRIKEATTLEVRAHEMSSWVLSGRARLAIHGGEVLMSCDGSLTVNIEDEDTADWKYLRQHTKKDLIWQALKEYKEAVTLDIATRRSLFLSVQAEVIGETNLPIKSNDTPIGAEYVDPLVLNMVYDRLFFTAIEGELPRPASLTNDAVNEETVWLGPHRSAVAAISHDPVSRAIIMSIADSSPEIDERILNEHPNVRTHYESREEAARRLNTERRRLQLAPSLPRSSKCDACKDLG